MNSSLQEPTLECVNYKYVDNNFYKYRFDTRKVEKVLGKFIRNPEYTTVQIAVDCTDAQLVDHEITITLNENKKYGEKSIVKRKEKFQILKLKNLLIKSFIQG
jgi:LEA14-like dessication related protein